MTGTIGYLSAAPRVSTRAVAAASGPRSHVLGMIAGFRSNGWTVREFIVGDRMPIGLGVRQEANGWSYSRRLGADVLRVGIGWSASIAAVWKLRGKVDIVYERLASLQAMGWLFHPRATWVLESNAIQYREAHTDRKSIAFPGLARFLERWAYRRCDLIVAVSEPLRELIERESGVFRGKIIVVPNGVDAEWFHPGRHAPVRSFVEPTIGFVGTLSNWQGIDLLFAALASLGRSRIHLNAVIIGDGQMRLAWERLGRDLGIGNRVRFTGRVDPADVPGYIAGCDLCFSGQRPPSIGEMYHSPLKLYEYLAMGKPAVASAYEDARAVVEEGVTGFLYDPLREGDLERALRLAWEARSQWADMGRLARERIERDHTWTDRARRVLTAIEERLGCRT